MNKRVKTIIAYSILTLLIFFNAYLFRNEFKVKIDPNDNIFQYALIDEAKNIWKNVFTGKLSPLYIVDSVNDRWAEGFALSAYYSHLPQAVISLIGLISPIGIYQIFIVIRTLMLIFLPAMFYWGASVLGFGQLGAIFSAVLSQLTITDGLYGIDISSYLWRGWGLSSQLFGLFFLPMAFAYAVDYLENKKNLGKAILFNFLVAQSHFGVFYLLLMAYPIYSVGQVLQEQAKNPIGLIRLIRPIGQRLGIFLGLTLFLLAYFIVPFFFLSDYRNFSLWDPLWKFNSWGARQIVLWFSQGDLFDFGRFPFVTLLVSLGMFWGLTQFADEGNKEKKPRIVLILSILFIFYFIIFLGRTTLGKLIDFIPGFSEYHLHRIILMVQFIGVFIAARFLAEIIKKLTDPVSNSFGSMIEKARYRVFRLRERAHFVAHLSSRSKQVSSLFLIMLTITAFWLLLYLEKPVVQYAELNNGFIERANKSYNQDFSDYKKITATLRILPKARIYAGKPGNWGRNFFLGETPLYMALSQDGFPVIGFLPESWSPNSDQEQFFDDGDEKFYNLYNVKYIVVPENIPPPSFAKRVTVAGKYQLYSVKTNGWFETGTSTIAVISKKTNLLNITRLWFGSNFLKSNDFARISLKKNLPFDGKWHIQMTDLNHFVNLNDTKERNIWQANPFSIDRKETTTTPQKIGQDTILPAGFSVEVKVPQDCPNCILVLKESYHPDWEVKLNGVTADSFPVFPFYIGIPIDKAGEYKVIVTYQPNRLKTVLLLAELMTLGVFGWTTLRRRL